MPELPTGRTIEHEFERLTVDGGPFGDDVGDEATVVISGQLHRAVDCHVDVDPVRPDVPSESDIQQVLERRPSDRWPERKGYVPRRSWRAPTAFDRLWTHGAHPQDEFFVRQVVAFADLQLVHPVDPMVRFDLLVEWHPPPELVRELPYRCLSIARAEDMENQLADVPTGAIGGSRPLLRRE